MSPYPEDNGVNVDAAVPTGYLRRTRKSYDESKETELREIERDRLADERNLEKCEGERQTLTDLKTDRLTH